MRFLKMLAIGLIGGLLFFINSSKLLSQGNYEQSIKALKVAYEKAITKQDFVELKNSFSRIAAVETDEWLPYYYETLCTLAWAFDENEDETKIKLSAQIEIMISELELASSNDVEVRVLKGRLLQLRSSMPTENMMQVGMDLFETIGSIVKDHPDNPRGLLLMGEIIIFSPKNFMGYSFSDGIAHIRRSAELLEGVKHTDSVNPSWGYDIAQGYIHTYDPDPEPEPAPDPESDPQEEIPEAPTPTPQAQQSTQSTGSTSGEAVIADLYNSETPTDYARKAEEFAQLVTQEPDNYVWHYYQAFSSVQLALEAPKGPKIDEHCDAAEAVLAKAPESMPADELYCLQALIKSTRISVDYNVRGLPYYMESERLLDQALKVNPDNPRAYYLKGQNQRYLPKDFGGGLESAKGHFEKSKELFENQESSDNPIRWGYSVVNQILTRS